MCRRTTAWIINDPVYMNKDSNIALYRQYRPDAFEHLVGQKHIQTILLNALKQNQVAHAYLFSGPRGTGKTTTARLVAKGLNCTNLTETGEPCNVCDICKRINNNQLIDIIEIDAASNRGIDEIRELREKIKFSPVHGSKKVFIIDEVHMLTKEAFNALLKTLEEPPSHAHLILATTEAHKIPPTIISRCQHFDFKRITIDDIIERLQYIAKTEGITCEDEALRLIAETSDGSLRDAIGLLEQMTLGGTLETERVAKNLGLVDFQIVDQFIEIIFRNAVEEGIAFINDVYAKGIDLNQLVKSTKETLRRRLLDDIDQSNTADSLLTLRIIKILDDSEKQLKVSTIPQLPLELLFIELSFNEPKVEASKSETPETKPTVTTPTTEPKAAPKQEFNNLSIDIFRQHWGEVIASITEPSLRMALRKAELTGFENNELIVVFNSKFEYEKMNTMKNRDSIQKGLKEVIGENISIKLDYDATPLPSKPEHEKPAPEQKPPKDDFASLISDLGATVINE